VSNLSAIFEMPSQCAVIVDGEDVDRLVFTSVDDLRTQIKLLQRADSLVKPCLATLQVARHACLEHGYKTKAKILEAVIKKQEGAK